MTFPSGIALTEDLYEFLATVSRGLAASLDFQSTLNTVSGVALPYLDSWCVVDIAAADGTLRRTAVLHPDSALHAHAQNLAKAALPNGESLRALISGADSVAGAPATIPEDALIAASGNSVEQLRALGIGSMFTVPLVARRKLIGAITFVGAAGRQYCTGDVALAEDIAARCALALDNARLFTEAQDARLLAAHMNERLLIASIEQHELAEQARDANLAKSRFLATMSHELRTPLNAIVGYADLINMGIAGEVTNDQRRYINKIQSSTHHLVGIINDILDLAKIQAGRLDIQIERVMASSTIEAAAAMVAPQATAAGIRLIVDTNVPASVMYSGDENRVRQVLVNLLANAVKFTAPGGEVSIGCGALECFPDGGFAVQGGPCAVFRVTDTGIGITEAEIGAIFEPFVQLDLGKTRTHGGTGLGLTISRELARRMGGDLTVVSVAGSGSTFSLWLPALDGEGEGAGDVLENRVGDRRLGS